MPDGRGEARSCWFRPLPRHPRSLVGQEACLVLEIEASSTLTRCLCLRRTRRASAEHRRQPRRNPASLPPWSDSSLALFTPQACRWPSSCRRRIFRSSTGRPTPSPAISASAAPQARWRSAPVPLQGRDAAADRPDRPAFRRGEHYLGSTLLFVLRSSPRGLSVSMPMLVVFRPLQGAMFDAMMRLLQTGLFNNYPAERRPAATAPDRWRRRGLFKDFATDAKPPRSGWTIRIHSGRPRRIPGKPHPRRGQSLAQDRRTRRGWHASLRFDQACLLNLIATAAGAPDRTRRKSIARLIDRRRRKRTNAHRGRYRCPRNAPPWDCRPCPCCA